MPFYFLFLTGCVIYFVYGIHNSSESSSSSLPTDRTARVFKDTVSVSNGEAVPPEKEAFLHNIDEDLADSRNTEDDV